MIRALRRWLAERAFANHVAGCPRCRAIVERDAPPAYLCDVGRELGKKAIKP